MKTRTESLESLEEQYLPLVAEAQQAADFAVGNASSVRGEFDARRSELTAYYDAVEAFEEMRERIQNPPEGVE